MPTARPDSASVPSGGGLYAGRPNALPAWRVGLAAWEWTEIAGSTMNGVNPDVTPAGSTGVSARINAWNPLAIDRSTARVYSAANGGHGDYAGNGVLTLDLSLDAPEWVYVRQPTAAASVQDCSGSTTHYLDGRPPSLHGYYCSHFVPGQGVVLLGATGTWQAGNACDMTYVFDTLAGDWDGGGAYPNTTWSGFGLTGSNGYGGQAQDHQSGAIYHPVGSGGLKRFNANGTVNTLATIAGAGNDFAYYRPWVYEHTRGKLFTLGDAYLTTSQGRVWTNDGGVGSWAPITFTGLSTQFGAGSGYGADYCSDTDQIVVATGVGGAIVTVDPDSYLVASQSTTGGGSIVNAAQGPFGRFKYSPTLGGFFYYPAYTSNVWFLATR